MIRATEELGQETVAAGAVPTGSLVPYCAHQIIYFSFWAQIMFIFTMLVCCSLGNGEGTEGTGRTELVSDLNKKATDSVYVVCVVLALVLRNVMLFSAS